MSRKIRRSIAEETLQIMEQGYMKTPNKETIDIAEIQQLAEENTICYTPEMSDELLAKRVIKTLDKATVIDVTNETTLNATRRLIEEGFTDVLCLNFASAKNPGGGFLGGSQAQEESIARATGLYNCLLKANEYYSVNRKIKTCFYTDYMIYSPNVPIFKDEDGNNLDKVVSTAILTAPAVNTGIVKKQEKKRVGKIEEVMKRRIEKVLTIALEHGHSTVVLGAWGCGVFQNDPVDMARYFKEVINDKFKNQFTKIVFAIYARNERFIKPFYDLVVV